MGSIEPLLAMLGIILLGVVQASAEVTVRSVNGMPADETLHHLRRALDNAEIWKRQEEFQGSAPFNTSVNNMALYIL